MRLLRRRRGVVALFGLLVAGACTEGGTRPPADSRRPALVRSLPAGPCDALREAPAAGEVTFLAGGRLFAVASDGAGPRCLARVGRSDALSWSATGDRVLLGGLRTLLPDGTGREAVESRVGSPHWSRPTGKATVHVAEGGRKLLKIPAEGGEPRDISFLDRHDEVAYHPAGTHVVVAGQSLTGLRGVFLATNTGASPQPLATGEDARRIHSLAFSHDGRLLFFAADHGDHHDVHVLNVGEGDISTLATSPEPVLGLTVSPFSGSVAVARGTCRRAETLVWAAGPGGEPVRVGLSEPASQPAGWLPDGALLVLGRTGCGSSGNLHVWQNGAAALLVAGVDGAAVRAVLPPPPRPPLAGAGVA